MSVPWVPIMKLSQLQTVSNRFSRRITPFFFLAWAAFFASANRPAVAETAPPPSLVISEITLTAARISWEPVADASRYEVSFGTDPDASNRGRTFVSGTSHQLDALLTNTRYRAKARTVAGGKAGPWSAIKEFSTLIPVIGGLTADEISDTGARLVWSGLFSDCPDTVYEIALGADPNGAMEIVGTTSNHSLRLSALKSETAYAVKLRARNARNEGPWSDPIWVTTLPGGRTQVRVAKLQHIHVSLDWPIVSAATGYQTELSSDDRTKPPVLSDFTAPPAEIRSLDPERSYSVRVRPLFPGRRFGVWSDPVVFKTAAPPAIPAGLTALEIGGSYVRVSWTAAETGGSYEIVISEDVLADRGRLQSSGRTEARLGFLAANTSYFLKVRSVNSGGSGEWSEPLAFDTLPGSAPRNPAVSNVTSSEALARWERMPGTAPVQYEIRYAPANGAWRMVADYSGQTLALEKLVAGALHHLQIRAKNQSGYGPWSPEVRFRTLPAPPQTAPEELHAENVTDISAQAVWQALPDADGYRVSTGTDTDAGNLGVQPCPRTAYVFKGLMPETNYFVKIKGYNRTGEGPWSEVLLIATRPSLPINAPANPTVGDITASSFRLTWEPSGDAAAYEVGLSLDPRGENTAVSPAPASTFIFTDLHPGTTYYAKVRKVNRGGGGPWSRVQTATTIRPVVSEMK